VEIILDGENPLKVNREYRGLTQQKLADKVGISRSYITDIEAGRKDSSIKVMKKIAEALNLEIDDIV
jgi:DNA-binding XRE family transcriptional regulator